MRRLLIPSVLICGALLAAWTHGKVGSAPPALACTYTPVTSATYNVAYTGATPSASGGVPSYTFSETGTLPTGFTLASSTGIISGTDSTDSGGATYPGIQVKVTDSASSVVNCGSSFTITVASGYTGPGDVASGAYYWGGLRGYSAAYSTGSNNAATVRRASDSTTTNIVILSNGNFDIATANTFAGTDATASCSISATTATCTGASSTPNIGDTITGAGVTNPCYATAVGTFTGGSGTVTVAGPTTTSPCGTVSPAVTMTFQVAMYLSDLYDQSGSGNHATQGTAGNQPQLFPNCGTHFNNLPCMQGRASLDAGLLITGSTVSVAQPFTVSAVAMRITGNSSYGSVFGCGNLSGSTSPVQAGFNNSSGHTFIDAGTVVAGPAETDGSSHSLQYVFNGNGSSSINVDNSLTGSLSPGTDGCVSGTSSQYMYVLGGNRLFGFTGQVGMWTSALSSTVQGNICHNDYGYYGTATSC